MKKQFNFKVMLLGVIALLFAAFGHAEAGVALATTGAVTGIYNESYVSSYDLNLRKIYPEMVQRYGDQGAEFIGMMMAMGWESTTDVPTLEHFEDDWIWDSFKVEGNTAGAAGASKTLTISSDSIDAQGNFYPAPKDIVEFPNKDSVGNPIQAYITSVTSTTITLKPLKAAWSIPAVSSNQTLIIITNGNSEGSGQPDPKARGAYLYTNKFAIGKASVEGTGSQMTDKSWVDEYDGKKIGSYFDVATQIDLDYRMMQNIQGWVLGGQEPDNTILDPDNSKAIKWTKGLFPTMNDVSIQHPYVDFDVTDFDEIERGLSKVYAGQYTAFMPGIELDIAVENALKSYLNYDNQYLTKQANQQLFGGDEGLAVSVGYSYIEKAKRKFAIKRFSTLHNPKTYGADGYDYTTKGVMFPLKNKNQVMLRGGKSAIMPTMRVVYKALGSYSRKMEVFKTGSADASRWGVTNDVDNRLFHQRCEFGFEVFAANQLVNLYKANG
jgi:hypothetical protein